MRQAVSIVARPLCIASAKALPNALDKRMQVEFANGVGTVDAPSRRCCIGSLALTREELPSPQSVARQCHAKFPRCASDAGSLPYIQNVRRSEHGQRP